MRLCPQALAKPLQVFASFRERWRVSRILGIRKSPRIHAELSLFGNCHRDREGLGRKALHFWTRTWSPRLKSVNNHKDRGGSLSQNGKVVRFGLASDRRGSKMAIVTGIGRVLVAKRRSVVTSWSPRLKSANNHKHRGGPCRKTQNCRSFELAFGRRVSKVSTVTGLGGSWPRSAELSSLLDLLLERRERLEEAGERREERREEERERKGQRRERRGERRKEREEGGEWREERSTIGDLVPRPNDCVLGPFWERDG